MDQFFEKALDNKHLQRLFVCAVIDSILSNLKSDMNVKTLDNETLLRLTTELRDLNEFNFELVKEIINDVKTNDERTNYKYLIELNIKYYIHLWKDIANKDEIDTILNFL